MGESIWIKQEHRVESGTRGPLKGDIERDALVVGAGMTGILTAYFLQKQGVETAVLEAETIGSGQTGRTAAKITSQHGLIYDYLLSKIGIKAAAEYAAANQKAIDDYEQIIEEERLSCGFQRLPAYLYTKSKEDALKREKKAAELSGIPCTLETNTELPFSVAAALRFDRQAQFHPMEFLKGLSENLEIYEHTPVIKAESGALSTSRGTARGKAIIFACHFPFINRPGYYFARMHQEKSYIVALKQAPKLEGMYYGIDPNWNWSFRSAGNLLLMGGGGHRTGSIPQENPYMDLKKQAEELWPGAEITANWSAQDCMPADQIPFIGTFSKSRPDWYVAAGFKKWGMTHAMVSARLLSEEITLRSMGDYKQAKKTVFSPGRLHLAAAFLTMAKNGAISAKNRIASLTGIWPKCPHLGCRLYWNSFEHTWECQCHGSRFQEEGGLLEGPAQKGLRRGKG